jgi:hypothetical protein
MRASHVQQPHRIGPHEPKIDSEVSREGRLYGVGDVDVLVGARLDELAADEEAHPWLRGIEKQQEPTVSRESRRVEATPAAIAGR